jgi:polysaccharide deacetylase family protein (PEP-CTERM system associated)
MLHSARCLLRSSSTIFFIAAEKIRGHLMTGERAAQSQGVSFRSLVDRVRPAQQPRPAEFNVLEAPSNEGVVDAVSVDLEDYFHVEAFASQISRSRWGTLPSRVLQNTQRTLEVLDRGNCRATFFVLGWIAEREPKLIHELARAGHELACHSHLHRPLHTLKPSEFRDDLIRSRTAIENAAGTRVVGFRAPTFSITQKSLWALEILAEEGFQYDSSIFPIHHDLYGMPDAPRWPHRRGLPSGQSIWEIPPSTVRMGKMNIPFGGGGYLRLLPMPFTRWAIRRTHRRERQPVVVYFHPWELDPDQPRLTGSWRSRVRHYTGLGKTANRLDEILSRGNFQPLINLVRRLETDSTPAFNSTNDRSLPWFDGSVPVATLESPAAGTSLKIGQSA